MSEQFGINRSLRYGTTVHSYVRTMFATTELMNNLRKTFLTYTAFASHQHRQICRRHLHGYIYRAIQPFGIADNAKS